MMKAAAPMIGGVICPPVELAASTAPAKCGLKPTRFIAGMVSAPVVTVPLVPGKNITVVCEVVAMNHLLKYSGVDTARLFNQRLQSRMSGTSEYLEEDYE